MLVERLELDFHIRGLHDLIDLAVLLAADKLAMLVGQLNLEANLVVELLYVTYQLCSSKSKLH